MSIQELARLLNAVPAGTIPVNMIDKVFKLVEGDWDEFYGYDETSMSAWKLLRDRGPEDVIWSPPCLSFTIDRHGGTVLGSPRAEKQRWRLNLETKTADHFQDGFRQLRPNAPRLDVTLVATDVCNAVQNGPSCASRFVSDGVLTWRSHEELIVRHGMLIDGEYQRTISDRRKRFCADLKAKMEAIDWELVSKGRWLTFKKRPK